MKLYLVEATVEDTTGPRQDRNWSASAGAASKARSRLTGEYKVKRADITTTEIEVDTRKEGLIEFLNRVTNAQGAI